MTDALYNLMAGKTSMKGGAGDLARALAAAAKGPSSGQDGPLDLIDESAAKCCRRAFSLVDAAKFPERLIFKCGICGAEFRPDMVGPLRHWRIVEHFAIVRPR